MFSAIYHNLPLPVVIKSADSRILFLNMEARERFLQHASNHSLTDLQRVLNDEESWLCERATLDFGEPQVYDFWLHRGQPQAVLFEVTTQPIAIHTSGRCGTLSVYYDVTGHHWHNALAGEGATKGLPDICKLIDFDIKQLSMLN